MAAMCAGTAGGGPAEQTMGDMELHVSHRLPSDHDQTTISDGVNNTLPRLLLLGESIDLVQRCGMGIYTRAFECEPWITAPLDRCHGPEPRPLALLHSTLLHPCRTATTR